MRRGVLLLVVLLLIGLVSAGSVSFTPITGHDVVGSINTPTNFGKEANSKSLNSNYSKEIREAIQENHRIKFTNKGSECLKNCTCSGSTVKCILPGGEREMTITAGKSGNIIVQIKGENMTTNVTLYKGDNGKIYGVFRNNETKVVRMLPDQVREKIKEKIKAKLKNESVELNDEGNYEYTAEKESRLLGLFLVKTKVMARINAETGEVISVRNKWWSFLARDIEAEPIVGAGCGTVTPGYNDECCQNKGYDVWNVTASECQFSQ